MIAYLELALRSRGVRVVAGVCDAPVLTNPDGLERQARMPINWWLQDRGNYLSLQVEPVPGLEADPLLDVGICFPEDELPPLCHMAWSMRQGDELLPLRISLPFSPLKVPPVNLWQEARPVVPLGPQERKRAQAAGAELLDAFAQRDLDQILYLLDYRLEEMPLGFEIDEDEHREKAQEEFGELISAPGYGIVPLRQDAIRTTPCCGGRVYQLTRPDGSPLIETLPTETSAPTTMGVFVASIKGDWKVVR